jgi:hypothetical protein
MTMGRDRREARRTGAPVRGLPVVTGPVGESVTRS